VISDHLWNGFEVALTGVRIVLLMLFLVATPFCGLGRAELPHISTGAIIHPDAADLVVLIRPGDVAAVGDDVVPAARIEDTVSRLLGVNRYRRVCIKADGRTKYGSLLPLFRAARAHGVPIAFVSREEAILEYESH
jgi:biopolymer transport protein ExbD